MKLLVSVIILSLTVWRSVTSSNKPNIIFILADDLGWADVSWHDSGMQTPNLYKLAHENAVRMDNAYVSFSTRSAFLTGMDPYYTGTQDGVFQPMEPAGMPLTDVNGDRIVLFPERLQNAGYKTYMIGKWHLGYCHKDFLPTRRGFDHFNGYYTGGQDYYYRSSAYKPPGNSKAVRGYDWWLQEAEDSTDLGKYSTEVYEARAKEYIDEHLTNNAQNPFFMYLAFQAVHSPLEVPSSYLTECTASYSKTWADRVTYCGMTYAMDVAIGNIVEHLKLSNLYDNTVIVFSTDNGGNPAEGASNWPYRGTKGTMWEGGTRAVSFIHSPQHFAAPVVSNELVNQLLFHVTDWYATILGIAGEPGYNSYGWLKAWDKLCIPKGNGYNQWPLLSGQSSTNQRDTVIYNLARSGSAIRIGDYKLVVGSAGKLGGWYSTTDGYSVYNDTDTNDTVKLYNLLDDPYEQRNLASIEPATVRSLRQSMLRMKNLPHLSDVHRDCVNEGHSDNFPSSQGNPNMWGWWGTNFTDGWCTPI